MSLSTINTVFMIDDFIKALPDNLPYDVKRQSVLNIIAASGTNLDNLLADGKSRLGILDKVKKHYSSNINESITQYKIEIDNLTQQINQHKNSINKVEKLLEEQSLIIEYERKKIDNILEFMNL